MEVLSDLDRSIFIVATGFYKSFCFDVDPYLSNNSYTKEIFFKHNRYMCINLRHDQAILLLVHTLKLGIPAHRTQKHRYVIELKFQLPNMIMSL